MAYYSVLVINVLDINRFESGSTISLKKDSPALVKNLHEIRAETRNGLNSKLTKDRLQEVYNDTVYYRDKLRSEFSYGKVSLRERSQGEELYWEILKKPVR